MNERGSLRWLCCPLCKRDLDRRADAYGCDACDRRYPIVLGIPDLRVYPDPHLSFAEDHDKGRQVEQQAERLSFAELLQFYWDHVAKAPPPAALRNRFVRHVLDDEPRAAGLPLGDARGGVCLDVGCGASALPRVLRAHFETVFATDIGFRWMVLARKRLDEAKTSAELVCCCADYLPFRSHTFDLVTAVSLVEHTPDARAVFADCARVLRDRGHLFVVTTNRYALAPEPHVRIWGLGFLPRSWMPRVVRWRRALAYDKFHLLSLSQVRRLLNDTGFSALAFSLPEIRRADFEGRSALERVGARVFRRVANLRALRSLLMRIAPIIQVLATRRTTSKRSGAA